VHVYSAPIPKAPKESVYERVKRELKEWKTPAKSYVSHRKTPRKQPEHVSS
jgi:hypothetical protein